jgi:uncharacterized protein (TIGR02217 family)
MVIINAPFPERISFGARSEPGWLTDMSASGSGRENANQRWEHTRHYYDVSLAVRTADDYALVRAHFHTVRGRGKGFLFKDPIDYSAVVAEGITEEAESSSEGWQLLKLYGSGEYAYERRITRPVSGSLTIYRTRSAVTTNVTGGATVDHDTGTFTVTGDMPGDVYTWAGEFRVPCRYDVDRLPTVIVNKQPGDEGQLFVQCDSIPLVEVRE